ncbi:MAG: DUF4900 domain-containing protein, partial [Armatimonadetes bacterium]|nr:DUF4900 domain-containing protein [Armatimonadota bacterium]
TTIMTSDYLTSRDELLSAQAFYVARAGISRAMAEMGVNEAATPTTPIRGTVGDLYATCDISKASLPSVNGLDSWKITSIGKVWSGASGTVLASRTLEAVLEQETFASYAYFTDQETSWWGTAIWFLTGDTLRGPVHSNGYLNVSGKPEFTDEVTTYNRNDSYLDRVSGTYNQRGARNGDNRDYYHFFTAYLNDIPTAARDAAQFAFNGGQAEIPLPSVATSEDALRVTGSSYVIPWGKDTYIYNGSWSTTSKNHIYVEGDAIVYGHVSGSKTISSGGNIWIADDITYDDKSTDALGLVANNHVIVQTNPYAREDLEINAAIMARNGSFFVNNYGEGVPRGTLKLYGSLIQKVRGPVGLFNPNTQTGITGYVKNYSYDKKLKRTPPPYFPVAQQIRLRYVKDKAALQE